MYFLEQDFEKIKKWLDTNSVKDSSFPIGRVPFTGREEIVAIQNGKNVKFRLLDIINPVTEGLQYIGIASPSTTPSEALNIFYIALNRGTYTYFNNIEITNGITVLYKRDKEWNKTSLLEVVQNTGLDEHSVMSQWAVTKEFSNTNNRINNNIRNINQNSSDISILNNTTKSLQTQIDVLESQKDVAGVVFTKKDLDTYDTSSLKLNDLIKVLKDESKNNSTTYYKLIKVNPIEWRFVGSLGEFYTKEESDSIFVAKNSIRQEEGENSNLIMSQRAITESLKNKASESDFSEYKKLNDIKVNSKANKEETESALKNKIDKSEYSSEIKNIKVDLDTREKISNTLDSITRKFDGIVKHLTEEDIIKTSLEDLKDVKTIYVESLNIFVWQYKDAYYNDIIYANYYNEPSGNSVLKNKLFLYNSDIYTYSKRTNKLIKITNKVLNEYGESTEDSLSQNFLTTLLNSKLVSIFDGIIEDAEISETSPFDPKGFIIYIKNKQLFTYRTGKFPNYIYHSNWSTANSYLNSNRTEILKDKIYICKNNLYTWNGSTLVNATLNSIVNELGDSSTKAVSQKSVTEALSNKQNLLQNTVNIKSINGNSILGEGNINTVGKWGNQGGEIFNSYFNSEGNLTNIALKNYSHAEGSSTKALELYSHAEGNSTTSSGIASHSEGKNTLAESDYSHAEGFNTRAISVGSHAEGYDTQAEGGYSHAEGKSTFATGLSSHAEGSGSSALGSASHAEGISTNSKNLGSHAEGNLTNAVGQYSHAEGNENLAKGNSSHAEGQSTEAYGDLSHTEGFNSVSTGLGAHSEGNSTLAQGNYSHAEGGKTKAIGIVTHAEGANTLSQGNYSHSEGNETKALGNNSHAENNLSEASGEASHAEGFKTSAKSNYSHSEGNETSAVGVSSHAEGFKTTSYGDGSHSEGWGTSISSDKSNLGSHVEGYNSVVNSTFGGHAEGHSTSAEGDGAHSEGIATHAYGDSSHSSGEGTLANNKSQFVTGQYNLGETTYSPKIFNKKNVLFSIGNGTDGISRSDALRVLGDGTTWVKGVGDFNGTNPNSDNSLQAVIKTAIGIDLSAYYTKDTVDTKLSSKQDTLVSGQNIATINGQTLTRGGNITIESEGSSTIVENSLTSTSTTAALSAYQGKVLNELKANKSEIPDTSKFITNEQLENKGYLTKHQDISGKLDVSIYNEKVKKLDKHIKEKSLNNFYGFVTTSAENYSLETIPTGNPYFDTRTKTFVWKNTVSSDNIYYYNSLEDKGNYNNLNSKTVNKTSVFYYNKDFYSYDVKEGIKKLVGVTIEDAEGDSTNSVMSQKAVTDFVTKKHSIKTETLIELDNYNTASSQGIYTVFIKYGSKYAPTGTLFIFSDNAEHVINQVFITNLTITQGKITGEHKDGNINIIYRSYNLRSPIEYIPRNTWSDWKYYSEILQDVGESTTATMSQKIISDKFSTINNSVKGIQNKISNIDNTSDKDKSVKYAETAGKASANDVYAWAKTQNKPSYQLSEIGGMSSFIKYVSSSLDSSFDGLIAIAESELNTVDILENPNQEVYFNTTTNKFIFKDITTNVYYSKSNKEYFYNRGEKGIENKLYINKTNNYVYFIGPSDNTLHIVGYNYFYPISKATNLENKVNFINSKIKNTLFDDIERVKSPIKDISVVYSPSVQIIYDLETKRFVFKKISNPLSFEYYKNCTIANEYNNSDITSILKNKIFECKGNLYTYNSLINGLAHLDGTYINVKSFGIHNEIPNINDVPIGFMFFDISLNKPIFKSRNNSNWTDANGTVVL